MLLREIFRNAYTTLRMFYDEKEAKNLVYEIFGHIFHYNHIQTHENFHTRISPAILNKINNIVERLKKYEPIQYIFESCLFYDCSLKIVPGVLIPRSETEELTDFILKENRNKKAVILEIGTGSGCIAIALARKLPEATVFATDISEQALQLAAGNAEKNYVKIKFLKNDILDPSPFLEQNQFDIVVSNPPYIRESEKKEMRPNVLEWEPHEALFVTDNNPLQFYDAICSHAHKLLKPGGKLYFEVNENLSKETANLMALKLFTDIHIVKDINGKDRMAWGRK